MTGRPFMLDDWEEAEDGTVRAVRVNGMVTGRVRKQDNGWFAAERFGVGGNKFTQIGVWERETDAVLALVEPAR